MPAPLLTRDLLCDDLDDMASGPSVCATPREAAALSCARTARLPSGRPSAVARAVAWVVRRLT